MLLRSSEIPFAASNLLAVRTTDRSSIYIGMPIQDKIFGKPLATSQERAEQIGVGAGIPIFGLDALTSAAYGPEAALSLLIPLGILGTQYLLPIITAILILLVIVLFQLPANHCCLPQRWWKLHRGD